MVVFNALPCSNCLHFVVLSCVTPIRACVEDPRRCVQGIAGGLPQAVDGATWGPRCQWRPLRHGERQNRRVS